MRAQARQKSGPRIKPVGRSIFLSSVFGYFFGNAKSIKHKKRRTFIAGGGRQQCLYKISLLTHTYSVCYSLIIVILHFKQPLK